MFDTHCHLNADIFEDDLDKTVNDARDAGVKQFLVPRNNLKSSKVAVEVVENYTGLYAAIGVHPTEDLEKLDLDEVLYQLADLSTSNFKIVAIGEIGLDYFRFSAGPNLQKEFFMGQVKLAVKYERAVVIHNRHATEDIIKCLDKVGVSSISGKAVFHCCPAEKEILDYAIENRIYIGVDGDVTYDETKAEFVKEIPLELLVMETDSPYLTPEPVRKTKKHPNEPKNIVYVVERVAELLNIPVSDLVKRTTINSQMLFETEELVP